MITDHTTLFEQLYRETVAGTGQHSHVVPDRIGQPVLMRSPDTRGTLVIAETSGFAFVSLDGGSTTTARRCALVRGLDPEEHDLPAYDTEPPDGLALVPLELDDDLSWLGERAVVYWDSAWKREDIPERHDVRERQGIAYLEGVLRDIRGDIDRALGDR